MDPWKLWFLLLLPLSFSSHTKGHQELLVKIICEQPDFTPICSNEMEKISLIVCQKSKEMSGGEDCRLSYRFLQGFQHDCESKFTLVTINQTVFLQLNNLTPADSGIFKCECSDTLGTNTLLLNFTVQEKENTTRSTETVFSNTVTGPTLLLIIITIIIIIIIVMFVLGVFYCRICQNRRGQVPITIHQQPEALDPEPYSVFMQKENELYLTNVHSHAAARNSDVSER